MSNGGKFSKAERIELRKRAYDLYAQRKDYRAIGEILGVSHETARQYVLQAIKEVTLPEIEESVKKDLRLLDQNLDLAEAQYRKTKSAKDYEVVDKILIHRAKLLGMFAPEKLQATVTQVTPLDASISSLLDEMEAKDKEAIND